jgi:hypothetical protein
MITTHRRRHSVIPACGSGLIRGIFSVHLLLSALFGAGRAAHGPLA